MEKESVKKFDLEAAFKALDEIEIPVAEKGIRANRVDLKERFQHKSAHEELIEDYYDVSSGEDLTDAQEERKAEVAQAKLARIEKIVDLDADTAEDLLPSYVGKVIIQCPQCMTLFYKNPEDIEYSDENPDVVNINEICQHCGNASGYTLIGKVDSVGTDEADNYTEEPVGEKNELDLNFEEPTKEVDAEGTGDGAEEMSDEDELSDDELKELDLDLEEIPEEESEDEKKEESLNLSKELKDAEESSELKTENESKNLTLNEEIDKDLDEKLKEHNDYIAYLQQMIKQEEEALKKADNEEVKAAIQRNLDAFNQDLQNALPDAVKNEPEAAEAAVDEPTEEIPEEEPKAEEEAPAEDQLTEDAVKKEKSAEDNEVNYVEYKHSYCHALEPKLKAINYLVNVKKVEPRILKGYILKLLKDPEIKWTEKEKEFKKNIEAKEDNQDILDYVKNNIEKAKTTKVKVDENGELVESLNEGFEGCLYETLTEGLAENALNESSVTLCSAAWKSSSDPQEEIYVEIRWNKNGSYQVTALTTKDSVQIGPALFDKTYATRDQALNAFSRLKAKFMPIDNFTEELTSDVEENLKESTSDLNEDASAEIDSIIASWDDTNESLNEEGNLDKILDSKEFQTPVSDAEIEAARAEVETESLKEDNSLDDPDNIEGIIQEWGDAAEDDKTASTNKTVANNTDKTQVSKDDNLDHIFNAWESLKEDTSLNDQAEADQAEDKIPAEDEPKEELPNVEFNTEEVKDLAQDVAEKAAEKAVEIQADEELDGEAKDRVADLADEKVTDAVEEKVEAEEAPAEDAEIQTEDEEPEFNEDDIDELDECSLNKHIDEYLQEVYSNVKSYKTTDCELKEGKLIVEGKISFNSGKEKLTMFEFLPAYNKGKLFFEGYNKDFSEDKAFTLNCSINESKTLITESFGYKYKINENLIEGLK